MSVILVADEMTATRLPIAAALQAAGYATLCAANSAETLQQVRRAKPDLVLLDLSMSAMHGLSVLESIRRDEHRAATPVIVLTACGDRDLVIKAARLGVRDYLLKSKFVIADLISRIGKYDLSPAPAETHPDPKRATTESAPGHAGQTNEGKAAVASKKNVLTSRETLERIKQADVKALPGAVMELLSLAGSSRGSATDVARCLKRDPALIVRVLRLANSASFASRRARISTIEDAVKHVGLSAIRNLAGSIGVFDSIADSSSSTEMLRSWQHSICVAMLMEKLLHAEEAGASGVAYMVGLCHDLPDIMMRQHFAPQCESLVELASRTSQPVRQICPEVFGLTYARLVDALLSRMGLPAAVISPIADFFSHSGCSASSGSSNAMSRALNLANLFAHGMLLTPSLYEPVRPLSIAACNSAHNAANLKFDIAALAAEAISTCSMIADSETSAKASEPLFIKHPLHIHYVRDPGYADFDPLLELLTHLADEVTVHRSDQPGPISIRPNDPVIFVSPTQNETMRSLAAGISPSPAHMLWLVEASASADSGPGPLVIEGLPSTIHRIADHVARWAGDTVQTRA